MASLYAALEAMKLLFEDGRIDLNAQNKYGETPLHLCAGSGDKGASKTTKLLLEAGAQLTVVDKWNRGPLDVSRDNAENPIVKVINEWLDTHPLERQKCNEISNKYKAGEVDFAQEQQLANMKAKKAIFAALGTGNGDSETDTSSSSSAAGGAVGGGGGGGMGALVFSLGNVKLKKTKCVEKTMFKADEGESTNSSKHVHGE